MRIPNSLKVGNYIYEVKLTDEVIILDNQVCGGICDYGNQLIAIDNTLTQQYKERVFLHELFHAMCIDRELDFDDKTEFVVDNLAKALHAVIIDNPHIFSVNYDEIEELLSLTEEDEEDECCGCSTCNCK